MANKFRNRVRELKFMRAGDILDNEGNWHIHPKFQTDATKGSLNDIGIVDVLIAYESERNDGALTFVDGHDRKSINPDQEWPVIILDIDDDEADTQLTLHDNIGKWGQIDALKLQALIEKAKVRNHATKDALERLRIQISPQVELARRMAGEEDVRKPRRLTGDYEERLKLSVKVVVPIEDDLAIVEKALKATGIRRRGHALVEIARFYLANKGEDESTTEG